MRHHFGIFIHSSKAKNEAEAKVVCRTTEAFKNIRNEYPKSKWDVRYTAIEYEEKAAGWYVMFEAIDNTKQEAGSETSL